MKNNFRQVKKLFIIMLVLTAFLPEAYASRARAKSMIDRMIQERKSGRVIEPSRLELEQRRFETQVERLLRRQSGLSAQELNMGTIREYVAKFERRPQELEALAEVLKDITSRGNVVPAQQEATANLLAQASKLSERSEFMVAPRDLLEVNRSWTVREKSQLADIMMEARQIAENNVGKTANQAFEEALSNRGLLEKFRQRCQ